MATISPERDATCYFMVHKNDAGKLCKRPLAMEMASAMAKFMPLKHFAEGGYRDLESKLLLCVRSIGPKTTGKHDSTMDSGQGGLHR